MGHVLATFVLGDKRIQNAVSFVPRQHEVVDVEFRKGLFRGFVRCTVTEVQWQLEQKIPGGGNPDQYVTVLLERQTACAHCNEEYCEHDAT